MQHCQIISPGRIAQWSCSGLLRFCVLNAGPCVRGNCRVVGDTVSHDSQGLYPRGSSQVPCMGDGVAGVYCLC